MASSFLSFVVVNIANEGGRTAIDSKMVVGQRKLDSITKGKCLLEKVNSALETFLTIDFQVY